MAAPILPAKCGRLSLQYRQGRYKTLVAGLAMGGKGFDVNAEFGEFRGPVFRNDTVLLDSLACPRLTKASAIAKLRAPAK